jgi:hypothetical protein
MKLSSREIWSGLDRADQLLVIAGYMSQFPRLYDVYREVLIEDSLNAAKCQTMANTIAGVAPGSYN